MFQRLGPRRAFLIGAVTTMALAAGGAWQFERSPLPLLNALLPVWAGIAAVFWALSRVVLRPAGTDLPPRPLIADFEPLRLDMRYADLSALPLEGLTYVVTDTETTGLRPDSDQIVQIGAVRIEDGKLLQGDSFERLVNPGQPIPAASTRFHGITDDMVARAPAIEEILQEFLEYAGDAVLVGHNIAFDIAFMNRIRRIENPMLDTMLLSIGAFRNKRDHTLDSLARQFDEEIRDRHTALGDAELTARVFLRMWPELQRSGVRRFGDAQDLCADSALRVRAMRPYA